MDDLRLRTREGIKEAKKNGKKIGQKKGKTLDVKMKPENLELIKKYSKDFDEASMITIPSSW